MTNSTNMLFSIFLSLATVPLFLACNNTYSSNGNEKGKMIKETAEAYFKTFSQRKDWEKMLSFYDSSIQFADIEMGIEQYNFEQFKDYYNWKNPAFQKLYPEQESLILEQLVVDGNTAIGTGRFTDFYWQGAKIEWGKAGQFMIKLEFTDQGKIISQQDFIHYPKSLLP